jgi:sugar fermentation stimulation protein A
MVTKQTQKNGDLALAGELLSNLSGSGGVAWRPGQPSPADSGIYVVRCELQRPRTIQVGRLGTFRFAPGTYLYVGSAQRALVNRLDRHARRRKRRRWHIDYLMEHAAFSGAAVLPQAPKADECRIAHVLRRRLRMPATGFGASDCQCRTHLFRQ